MATDIKLPELGEGIERAEIVRVLVAPGDQVEANQTLLEIETDKATVEVPATEAGTVTDVAVTAGAMIGVGERIVTLDADGGPAPPAGRSPSESAPAPPGSTPAASESMPAMPEPTPTASDPVPAAPEPRRTAAEPVHPPADRTDPPGDRPATRPSPTPRRRKRVLAAPSVRKLAREIGVDVDEVAGSGRSGRVDIDDVKAHARRIMTRPASEPAAAVPTLPDASRWGPITRAPLTGVRRTIARRMSQAWQTVPHVTQHDQADVSEFEAVRRTVARTTPERPLTVTAFAVSVAAAALKAYPQFNASLDMARDEIVYKQSINIGVAVDTERGLLVPVIKDADQKSLGALSAEIAALAEKVRSTGAAREDLEGATFTITNLGGLGGGAFTPIINYPEVAILGLSRAAPAPVYVNERFEARSMLPLSLSYDHRLIDGADGVRFLRWVAARLEHPLLLEL